MATAPEIGFAVRAKEIRLTDPASTHPNSKRRGCHQEEHSQHWSDDQPDIQSWTENYIANKLAPKRAGTSGLNKYRKSAWDRLVGQDSSDDMQICRTTTVYLARELKLFLVDSYA